MGRVATRDLKFGRKSESSELKIEIFGPEIEIFGRKNRNLGRKIEIFGPKIEIFGRKIEIYGRKDDISNKERYFCPKIQILVKNRSYDQNRNFGYKLIFLSKIEILDIWSKIKILDQYRNFGGK